MCFVRVRLHRQGEQSEESLERYTVFVIESARMVLSPPVDTAVSLLSLFKKIPIQLIYSVRRFRHDRLLNGKHGLRPGKIHDKMLRS